MGIADGKATGIFEGSPYQPDSKDEYDVTDRWEDEDGPLRKRTWNGDQAPPGMRLEREIAFYDADNEDEPTRIWRWYVRRAEAPSARSRDAYPLEKHLEETKATARAMVTALKLPADLADAVVAAQCHDLGKRRKVWQNSIGNNAYPQETWAKSGSRAAAGDRRTDYRHEFGSLRDARQPLFAEPAYDDLVPQIVVTFPTKGLPRFRVEFSSR